MWVLWPTVWGADHMAPVQQRTASACGCAVMQHPAGGLQRALCVRACYTHPACGAATVKPQCMHCGSCTCVLLCSRCMQLAATFMMCYKRAPSICTRRAPEETTAKPCVKPEATRSRHGHGTLLPAGPKWLPHRPMEAPASSFGRGTAPKARMQQLSRYAHGKERQRANASLHACASSTG